MQTAWPIEHWRPPGVVDRSLEEVHDLHDRYEILAALGAVLLASPLL